MRGRIWSVIGLVMAVAGGVFFFQGVGLIGGSFMTGSGLWVFLGLVIATAGLTIYARSLRRSET